MLGWWWTSGSHAQRSVRHLQVFAFERFELSAAIERLERFERISIFVERLERLEPLERLERSHPTPWSLAGTETQGSLTKFSALIFATG
jgi:hypothetical protein